MATSGDKRASDGGGRNWTLHEMFHIVGDQLLPRDVRVLKFLYSGVFQEPLSAKIKDGFTFFLALERIGRVDESNFKCINNALRMIVRHDLIPLVTLRRRKPVEPDPVDLYLQESSRKKKEEVSCWKRKPPFFNQRPEAGPSERKHLPVNQSNTDSVPPESKRMSGCLKRKSSSRLKGKTGSEIPEKRQATRVTTTSGTEALPSNEGKPGTSNTSSEPDKDDPQAVSTEGAICEAPSASSSEVSGSVPVSSSLVRHSVSTSPRRPSNAVLSQKESSQYQTEACSSLQSAKDDRPTPEDSLEKKSSSSDSVASVETAAPTCNSPSPSSPQPSTSSNPSPSNSDCKTWDGSPRCSAGAPTCPPSSKSPKSDSSKIDHGESYHNQKLCPDAPKTSLEPERFSQPQKQLNDCPELLESPRQLVPDCQGPSSSKSLRSSSSMESPKPSTSWESPSPSTSSGGPSLKASPADASTSVPKSKVCRSTQTPSEQQQRQQQSQTLQPEIRKKVTCDIRLRVRAEYCHHESALQGNVFSNKPELLERQFEKFMQANTILKSRDLGSIICDIKFSELTYLDAFWRDYINGSLLEALKGVFITESLKQAVGHEAIKLLVNVDEDDYEAGRQLLLQNLRD